MSTNQRRRRLVVAAVLCTTPLSSVQAQNSSAGSIRAERLVFDPAEGAWRELEPPVPGTPEGDLALAREALSAGHAGRARRAIGRWTKHHGADHALAREARLVEARALVQERSFYAAHQVCDTLLAEIGSDSVSQSAAELDFVIAEVFLNGTRRKWLGMRILSAQDIGVQILERLGTEFGHLPVGEYALMAKADYYFDQGDFDFAEDEYGRVLNAYPTGRHARRAAMRRAQAALGRFPGTRFDDAALVEAEERYIDYSRQYPEAPETQDLTPVLDDIRSKRAHKELEVADYYRRVDQRSAAAFYYRSVIENWPGTAAAAQAETRLQALEPVPAEAAE